MMPAFDASMIRGAWEGDGSKRSGPVYLDTEAGKDVLLF